MAGAGSPLRQRGSRVDAEGDVRARLDDRVSARRDARGAVAPARGPAFPPELLDANDVAWLDASDTLAVRAETGEGEFAIRFARRHRHRLALEEFAREHDLMSDKY